MSLRAEVSLLRGVFGARSTWTNGVRSALAVLLNHIGSIILHACKEASLYQVDWALSLRLSMA